MSRLRRRAWQRWQNAAGPWRAWAICPALAAPLDDEAHWVTTTKTTRSAGSAAAPADALARELVVGLADGPPTAVVLDLEPSVGVRIAARMHQWRIGHAVLVLPRWPYAQAILPLEGVLQALMLESRRLAHEAIDPPLNVVFVLDAERSRPVTGRPRSDARADNRYILSAADLPDLAALRARGIRRVLRVTRA
ncbi:MAG TPA: hypothetical protein VF937_18285 [Chloroflexota bacterium]